MGKSSMNVFSWLILLLLMRQRWCASNHPDPLDVIGCSLQETDAGGAGAKCTIV
jgi:hypothetical protein